MSTPSRRQFVQGALTGFGAVAASRLASAEEITPATPKLPREVWIASMCQDKMGRHLPQEMVAEALAEMAKIAFYQPDIICLPEVFAHYATPARLADAAEEPLGPISRQFAEVAAKHRCYVICPIYTQHSGRFYNAAVVIDRNGQVLGEYQKIHTTEDENDMGVTPGPLDTPVFKTDFGVIGVQICFDINWQDGWAAARKKGAEIIFWPSAFGGGQQINAKAWWNKCAVVSSTRKGTTKICDVDGTEIAATGQWNPVWAIGALNLEKVFLHTWPYVQRFEEIQRKYGRAVRIKNYHEEEWSILESLSLEVRVADIVREFELKTHEEHIAAGERDQLRHRLQ